MEIALGELPQLPHVLHRAASLMQARARLGGIDLILLDLGLPESQGLPTLKALLPAGGVPIVVLSGHSDPDLEADALAAGAKGYLPKNQLTSQRLHAAIEGALQA